MSKVRLIIEKGSVEIVEQFIEFFKNKDVEFEISLATDESVDYEIADNVSSETATKAASVIQDFAHESLTKKLGEQVSNIFITIGIPAHIRGYNYLREAVRLTIEEPEIINCITKRLYPAIAKRFKTSASKVERAIRHAIDVGWSRGKIENFNNVFGVKVYCDNDKPTNGEFIALVADKMLLKEAELEQEQSEQLHKK